MSKNYLVVGDSQGIGYAVAESLTDRCLGSVLGISRSPFTKCIRCLWEHEILDVSDLEAASEWVSLRAETDPQEVFSGVVFCQAKHGEKSGTKWNPDEWESYFRTNCTSVVNLIYQLSGHDKLANDCSVVLFGSFLQNGSANQPAYAASKAALWAWMRSYTMEQKAGDRVAVNMIWPGRVDTPSNPRRDLPANEPNFFRDPSLLAGETLRLLEDELGRRGTTIDVGRS